MILLFIIIGLFVLFLFNSLIEPVLTLSLDDRFDYDYQNRQMQIQIQNQNGGFSIYSPKPVFPDYTSVSCQKSCIFQLIYTTNYDYYS